MDRIIKLVFIGAGKWMQTYHLPSAAYLQQNHNIVIHGIWNRTRDKAVKLANEYGIKKVYQSADEVFNDTQVDGIVLVVSRFAVGDLLKKAQLNNLPVLVEKPPAATVEELKSIAQISHNQTLVAFNRIFTPIYKELEKHVKNFSVSYGKCVFHRRNRQDSHFIIETGIHALMTLDMLFGPGTLLKNSIINSSETDIPRWESRVAYGENHEVIIDLDFNPMSELSVERYFLTAGETRFELFINQHFAPDDDERLVIKTKGRQTVIHPNTEIELERAGYLGEYYAFKDCILKKNPSLIPLSRVVRVMELAEKIETVKIPLQ